MRDDKRIVIFVEDGNKLNVFMNTEQIPITFMRFNGDFGDFVNIKVGDVYLNELKDYDPTLQEDK